MQLSLVHSATSVILRVFLMDSSVSTGAGKTGLTSASSGLIVSTIADNEASATVYAQASSNIETITTLGTFAAPTASKCRFKEVDATNHPGLYEIQIADARFAVASAKFLIITISGASGLAPQNILIQLEPVSAKMTTAERNAIADAIIGRQPSSETYAADGAIPNIGQFLFGILQRLTEFSVASTIVTVKKLNGSDTAYTLTLNDGTSPTSSTRS